MKRTLILAFLFFGTFTFAQDSKWKFINGDRTSPGNPVYGTKGVAAAENTPGWRITCISWSDSKNMWIYGGTGAMGAIDGHSGYAADLWRYEFATNRWAWEGGDTIADKRAVYGKKGVATPFSTPGVRKKSASWTDSNGNLWLFGGEGYAGYLNDLWKYDPVIKLWSWMGGDTTQYIYGRYGTLNQGGQSNSPGSRIYPGGWTDNNGRIYIFGGYGYARSTFGPLNDLWIFDTAKGEWSWAQGDSVANVLPVYGKKSVPAITNKPTGRLESSFCSDGNGNAWMFGGQGGKTVSGSGYQNDLWYFNGDTRLWTWMGGDTITNVKARYGIAKNYDTASKPGSRYGSVSYLDAQGNFYVMGGSGNTTLSSGILNDLWKFDPSKGMWTWLKGDSIGNRLPIYPLPGVADPSLVPPCKYMFTGVADSAGNLYIFGGSNYKPPVSADNNEVWRYNQATGEWAWLNGTTNSYGYEARRNEKFVAASSNNPGSREGAIAWNGHDGTKWLFGGMTYLINDRFPMNDLWLLQGNTWTWISGSTLLNQGSVYGTSGVPAAANTPGARSYAAHWTDRNGNLWLYGGERSYIQGYSSLLGDFWKFSPFLNQWTWMGSGDSITHKASYGEKGLSAASNHPGARKESVCWTDANGDFWLFGGTGNGSTAFDYNLNDLWKYNTSTGMWTWMTGDTVSADGVYGTRGVGAARNTPGSRTGATGAIDANGELYLYGGYGNSAKLRVSLDDLWKYTPSTGWWTYLTGDTMAGQQAAYGTMGIPSPTNTPGNRYSSSSFMDDAGNFYLFGGYATGYLTLNDLWKYQPATNQWTWIGGEDIRSPYNRFGIQTAASSAVKPSARYGMAYPSDRPFWFFGGQDYNGLSNEVFQYSTGDFALPVKFITLTASAQANSIILQWSTASEFKSDYFVIERSSSAGFDSIGSVSANGFSSGMRNYSFNDFSSRTGNVFYRIRSVDKDGLTQYSQVVQIKVETPQQKIVIRQNPAHTVLQFSSPANARGTLIARVQSIDGKTLLTTQFQLDATRETLSVPLETLGAGSYVLSLQSAGFNGSTLFIKN